MVQIYGVGERIIVDNGCIGGIDIVCRPAGNGKHSRSNHIRFKTPISPFHASTDIAATGEPRHQVAVVRAAVKHFIGRYAIITDFVGNKTRAVAGPDRNDVLGRGR